MSPCRLIIARLFHSCDYVKITTESGFLIGQYSGPRFPFKVIVKSDEAKRIDIIFKSDESVYKAGFHANYHVYGKPGKTCDVIAAMLDPTFVMSTNMATMFFVLCCLFMENNARYS